MSMITIPPVNPVTIAIPSGGDTTNQQQAGGFALLLLFTWGDGNVVGYTNWSEPITFGGTVYNPETRIAVDPSAQTGAVRDESWMITMFANTPGSLLVRPCVFWPVTVTVYELDPMAQVQAAVLQWSGEITNAWSNLKDKPGCVKLEVSGARWLIQYPMGVESKSACSRTFGDQWCGFNLAAVTQQATVTAVSGKIVTFAALTVPAGKPAEYFTFGTVSHYGLSIGVADGRGAGINQLRLWNTPPPELVGLTVAVSPGCDKSYGGDCGCTGWANTGRHFGLGGVKPPISPVITPR